jgi:hypothetical protein
MSETVKEVADRLGITPEELERRIDEARAAIRSKVAALDLPPGYEPGAIKFRFADKFEPRGLWVRPGQKGRPAVDSPLAVAVEAEERRIRAETGHTLRAQSARRAAEAAGKVHSAKGDKTRAAVEGAVADGARKHTIPERVKKSPRRVNQILAASGKKKSP